MKNTMNIIVVSMMALFSSISFAADITADGTMSLSDRQLGEFKDKYKVVKSKYGWIGKGGIIILIMELKKRGFSYPKFMVRSMTPEGELRLGDWDDTLIYGLRRVK